MEQRDQQTSSIGGGTKVIEVSGSENTCAFSHWVWVRTPMYTMGNKVWYPNRGCRNLVLPYCIYNYRIKSDSKSFGVPPYLTRDVPENGSSINQPVVEEQRYLDIGTNVDSGITEYLFSGTFGTNVDQYIRYFSKIDAGGGMISIDEGRDINQTNSICEARDIETISNRTVNFTENDVTVWNTGLNLTALSLAALGVDKDINRTASAGEITDKETVLSLSIDSFLDIDNVADTCVDVLTVTSDNETLNPGVTDGCGDTAANTNKASSSTSLVFWNSNNCNTASGRDTSCYLQDCIEVYTERSDTQLLVRSGRYFPLTESEQDLYAHPSEYCILPGGYWYGRVEDNPNSIPGNSKKHEWLQKFVSWSGRLCAVGMLLLLGYCMYGKYHDKCL